VSGRNVVLCALGIALLAGCGNDANSSLTTRGAGITRQIAGSWTAKLHQKGIPPFTVAVHIAPDGGAAVAYTGIKCGGEWLLDHVQSTLPPHYVFTERIDQGAGGKCKGVGRVSIAPIQAHAPNEPAYRRANYLFTGGGVTSQGLLRRVHPAELKAIFKRLHVSQR
jgi:hypothetical protein